VAEQRRDPGGLDLLAAGPEHEGGSAAGTSRWVWRVAGLLAVGLAAALAGPGLLSSPEPQQPRSSDSPGPSVQGAPTVRPNAPQAVPPLGWATRGPEVGSDVAVAALARMRAQRPGVDRLLWAGSFDGHDHVVVASYRRQPNYPTDATEVAALRFERTSDLETARSQTIGYVSEADGLVGLAWQGEDRHTRLLVLSRPAALPVEVSSAIDYHASGSISRRWHRATLHDGAGVTDLGRHVDPVIVVRPQDLGSSTSASLVVVHGRPEQPSPGEVTISGISSPSYAGPDTSILVGSLARAVGMLFDLRDADSTVLWSGQIAGGRSDSGQRINGRAALVLVRRHDGPVLQAFVYSDPKVFESATANAVRWSIADRLPYAFSTYEAGAPLVLVNPGGPGSATLTRTGGPPLRVKLDGNGVATLSDDGVAGPNVSGVEVVVRDPSGRRVLRSTMVDPGTVDAFGLYL
jgi:hypothetical protein